MSLMKVLLFLISFSSFANITNVHNQKGEAVFPKYSAVDKEIASLVSESLRQMKAGELNQRDSKKLKELSSKTQTFRDFIPTFERMSFIALSKKVPSNFFKACSLQEKDPSLPKTLIHLDEELDRYCRSRFLIRMLSIKKESIGDVENMIFLQSHLPFYLDGESKSYFKRFLRRVSTSQDLSQKIAKLILTTPNIEVTRMTRDLLSPIMSHSKLAHYIRYEIASSNHYKINKKFFILYKDFKELHQKENYDEAFRKIKEAVSFYHSDETKVSKQKAWPLIISSGKYFLANGQRERAQFLFEESFKMATGNNINESLFHLLWVHISQEDFIKARQVVDKYSMLDNFSDYNSKLQYWIAKILEKSGEKQLSAHLLKKIIATSPLSFYAIIAEKDLGGTSEKKKFVLQIAKPSSIIKTGYHFKKNHVNSIIRARLWNEVKQNRLAFIEAEDAILAKDEETFKSLVTLDRSTKDWHKRERVLYIIKLFQRNDRFLSAFKLLHRALDKKVINNDLEVLSYLFPFPYHQRIKGIAKEIDPLLILSLVRQESAFNPYARSSVGARGLMQLMPSTARKIHRGLKSYHLKKPSLNLKIGIKFFKKLLKKYDGNLVFALAAYNAGQRKVDNWKDDFFKGEDPISLIESIPYSETRKYVKLIYRNMHYYQLLSNKLVDKSVKESFKVSFDQSKRP